MDKSIEDVLFEDSQEAPSEDILQKIGKNVEELAVIEDEIEALNEQLKAKKEEQKEYATRRIPELMAEAGVEKLTTSSGIDVSIKPFYSARITDATHDEAFAYLERSGNEGIIKSSLSIELGKGDEAREQLAQASEAVKSLGLTPIVAEKIHPKTLEAFVRDQIESGAEGFPKEAFNVFMGSITKIKKGK